MRIERWAFSKSEQENPIDLNRDDELYAIILDLPEGIIVYRNGEVGNRWEDGTTGVPKSIAILADSSETLYHPIVDESTDKWLDVQVDHDGNFVRFVETGK